MTKNLIIVALLAMNAVFLWSLIEEKTLGRQTYKPQMLNSNALGLENAQSISKTNHQNSQHQIIDTTQAKKPNALQDILRLSNGDYQSVVDQLRSQGYDESLLRQIMLASLNRDHLLAQAEPQANSYWQPSNGDSQDKLNGQLDWETQRRDQLLSLFGPDITDDPLFEEIFKPLNQTLPFLSSNKQIELDKLQRKDESMTQALFKGGFTAESRADLSQQRDQFQRQITELLGIDDTFEYQLRESNLADRLRRGLDSFDYSESEFRDIFSIRQTNEGAELISRFTDRNAYRTQREQSEDQIRDYLGDNRYAQYARSQDPSYRSLQSIGERYGNSTSEINDIYTIAQETQEEIDNLRNQTTLDRDQRSEKINELQSTAFEKIEAIAGAETAESVRENSRRLGFGRRF